ncbi:hypothetical protein BH11PLA2_BH11PLA2_47160 [soil metagenome]
MTAFLLTTTMLFAPAQAAELKLTNVRNTYGELGGTRPDSKFLPGDVLFVGFDIEGITLGADGRVQYRMLMEVNDKNAKQMFKQDPSDKVDYVPLGGNKLPGRAYVLIGQDMEPGTYTLKLTVTDNASKQTKSFEKGFEVTKKDFGIVGCYPSVDVHGQVPAPTTGIVGQSIFIQFAIVGFEKDKDEKKKDPKNGFQPNVTVEFTPIGDDGKPTLAKPEIYTQNSDSQIKLEPNDAAINVRFLLPMTRAGKYTVRLKATDNNTQKTATFDLPVVVVPSAN